MCWHNWTKWSEPKEALVSTYDKPLLFADAKPIEIAVMTQKRSCNKCGKYQWRRV